MTCPNPDCRLPEDAHGFCHAQTISECFGGLQEQHVPKRSQGGKWIAAILCEGHHDCIDNGTRYHNQRLANDVHTDSFGRHYRVWERGKGEALVIRQLPEGTYGPIEGLGEGEPLSAGRVPPPIALEGETDETHGAGGIPADVRDADGLTPVGSGGHLSATAVAGWSSSVGLPVRSVQGDGDWEQGWVDRFYAQWVSTGRHTMALRQMVEDYRLRYTGDNWHKRCSQAIEEHKGIHFQDATLDDWSRQYRAYEDAAADPAFAEYKGVLQALGPSVWREIAHAPQEHWGAMVEIAVGEVADGGIQPLLAARVRREGQREGLLPSVSYRWRCPECNHEGKQQDFKERDDSIN